VWRGDFRGLVPPKDVIESLEEPLEPSYLYRGAISGFWGLKTHVHGKWAFSIQFELTEGAKKRKFGSLGGRSVSVGSLAGHPEKGW